MANINTLLTRSIMVSVTGDVRRAIPGVNLREAWVWKAGEDHWEFHYKEFYWHGSADNAYEARSNGWTAYLESINAPGYERAAEVE